MRFARVHLRKHLPSNSFTKTKSPWFPVKVHGKWRHPSFTPTSPGYTYGCCKNTDGNYYFVALSVATLNRDPWVYRYNPKTNLVDQDRRLVIGIVTDDTHRLATIAHDSSGHIYVCFEHYTTIPGEPHGSIIDVYKTTTPFDISTLALLSQLSGRYSYPFIEVVGSNVFVAGRGSTDTVNFIRGKFDYFLSTNAGVTFGAAKTLYNSGNEQKVAYFQRIHGHDGHIYLMLNERDNDTFAWTFVAVLKGTIGSDVWTNVQGTFSKNISVSGAITRAEIVANFIVYESPNYATIAVNCDGGICKSDGEIKLIITVQTYTGNEQFGNPESALDELRFYYSSGGAWAYNVINVPPGAVFYWAYQRFFQCLQNDEPFDDVIIIDPSTRDINIHRSTDNFATETTTFQLTGNGQYRMGTFAYNVLTEEDYFLVLSDTPGDIFEIFNEGSEDYSDILLCKNIII